MYRPILLILLSISLGGCAIFNPYENDFSCPDTFHGKCISVTGAYNQALREKAEVANSEEIDTCIGGDCKGAGNSSNNPKTAGPPITLASTEGKNFNAYKDSLYRRLDNLLREPQTPVVAPAKVMRILFLPYKGQDGEFVMTHHVFFFADDPKWVLGNDIDAYDD